MTNIGKTIRIMRMSRGMSQAELAERIGKKRSAVGNYENGTREPDLDTIEALADVFNVAMADLLGDEKEANGEAVQVYGVEPDVMELVSIYRDLNATGQSTLMNMARSLNINPDMKKGSASNAETA